MGKRLFVPLPLGWQSAGHRFPDRRSSDYELPRLAKWRCNLTGLSVSHNFYFVAIGADIYVYEPQHPSQAIKQPVLIIPSSPSAPNLPGYIDWRHPNDVNNLVVACLGNEETIATVRDDGDVDVFLVRHIAHAVHLRATAREQLSLVADQVRPVFQRNVGASAWGLAIHTQARVIGVSSNRHEVTIFRFGLVDGLDATQDASHVDDRQFDADQCVVNGDANIPCIAFCNTGDDPTARWLLTTDINGVCRTVDVHESMVTQSFTFGRSLSGYYENTIHRILAGWSLFFLDRRSFTPEDTMHDALGLDENEQLPDAPDNTHVWDLTPTTRSLPGASQGFIRWNESTFAGVEDSEYGPRVIAEVLRDFYDHAVFYEEEEEEEKPMANAYRGPERLCGFQPRFSSMDPLCEDLPCPILYASVRNVYLLQPSSPPSAKSRRLVIGMAYPLMQDIQADQGDLNHFDRLNMSIYLPELGVVIVASQKGRVLILGLTKLPPSADYPAEYVHLGIRTNYAMRIEGILPTMSDEMENKRPFAPLHGIAAAPMQGTESLVGRKKRWRLLLMYQDHSILSYELFRKTNVADQETSTIVV